MVSSAASPAGEGLRPNPGMYDAEQSDRFIVPGKPLNKGPSISEYGDRGLAEMVEGRDLTKGNLFETGKTCTQ